VNKRDGGSFKTKIDGQETELIRSYTLSRWTFILDNTGKVIYKDTEADFSNDNKKVIKFLQSIDKDN
jgi:peroxiredoxin